MEIGAPIDSTYGAYERFNYGDLLFPIVLDHVYGNAQTDRNGSLRHVSVKSSDLRGFGARQTSSVSDLMDTTANSLRMIVGGGEVAGAGWFSMWGSYHGSNIDPLFRLGRKFVPKAAREGLARKVLGGKWEYPFVPEHSRIDRVGFNAIGASHSRILPQKMQIEIWSSIGRSNSVSVRDSVTSEIASKFGVNAPVVPDSVAALFELPEYREFIAEELVDVRDRPTVIQMSRGWMDRFGSSSIGSLNKVAKSSSGVKLLPVGLASGHSDRVALTLLAKNLDADVEIVDVDNIGSIIREIAGAGVVIGSSLHVNITAMAAGIPNIPLEGVAKLESYVQTWGDPEDKPVSSSAIFERFNDVRAAPRLSYRRERAREQARFALDSTRRVIEQTFL